MNSARMSGANNRDNTAQMRAYDFQAPAYAASIAIVTKQNMAVTVVQPAVLTGNLTLTIGVGSATTDPQIGDEVKFLFRGDGVARTVTFSTGFQTAGTLTTVISKAASCTFMFDGTGWQEMSRAIQA